MIGERDFTELYRAHLAALSESAAHALSAEGYDALVIHSGVPHPYFTDDQDAPFRTNPAFAHFVPMAGPHHLLHIAPGEKPVLVRVQPEDFWREHLPLGEPFWANEYDIRVVSNPADAWHAVQALSGRGKRIAYIGENTAEAVAHGIAPEAVNAERITARLAWRRSYKTPYEIECIAEANHAAAHAHEAAREAFLDGAPELEIHYAYLDELGVTEKELPYETVVALDEKAAILHYQGKRVEGKGTVLLLDAGASFLGYASDITRTYLYEEECDFLFRGLVGGVETVQQELVRLAVPGASFAELHHAAHVALGDLLHSFGILDLSGEEALVRGLTKAFFPHGLGHFLGIQVHDVGGNQAAPEGGVRTGTAEFPNLRMARELEPGMVCTVEPGIYFIDTLLAPHRSGENAKHFDWALIDRLKRFGGIRIEDDILLTQEGNRNITREFLP